MDAPRLFPGKPTTRLGTPGYVPSLFPTKPVPSPRSTKRAQSAGTEVGSLTPKKRRRTQPRGQEHHVVWDLTGHDYLKTTPCKEKVSPTVTELRQTIVHMATTEEKLQSQVLSIDNIKGNDRRFLFYTGLPNYRCFEGLCDFLYSRSDGKLNYWRGAATTGRNNTFPHSSRRGPTQKLDFQKEFFLILVKLRTGKFNVDLAREMSVSESSVSRIVTTWVNFLAVELKDMFEMKVNLDDPDTIPPCYRSYKFLRVLIDCTELTSERSSNLQARKETFSNHKSRDTIKFMVGLSPNLTVNFVSAAYGSRASDKHITLDSTSMLEGLPDGSDVMADRGFRVGKELSELCVKLIIPHFKGRDRSQMSQPEVQNSEEIAMAQIHIERIIQRIRNFHVLDSTMKLSRKDVIEQMFTVCAYLVNFQTPIKDTSAPLPVPTPSVSKSVFDYIE